MQIRAAGSFFHPSSLLSAPPIPLSLSSDPLRPLAPLYLRFCHVFVQSPPLLARYFFVSSCCETDGFRLREFRSQHTQRWMCRRKVPRGPNFAVSRRPTPPPLLPSRRSSCPISAPDLSLSRFFVVFAFSPRFCLALSLPSSFPPVAKQKASAFGIFAGDARRSLGRRSSSDLILRDRDAESIFRFATLPSCLHPAPLPI